MKKPTMFRRAMPLVFAAIVAAQAGSGWAATAHKVTTRTYKGAVAYVDHGPVQVSIVTKNKKIISVSTATSPEGARSSIIQDQAIPLLKQETLKAQNANINVISGATDTSGGFIQSLQSAVSKARKAKMLK